MRDSFILYTSYASKMDKLNDEQFGKVMRAVFDYQRTGEEPVFDDLLLDVCFSFIKEDLDANNEKYENVCKQRSEAGKKGGRPRKANAFEEKAKKANAFSEKQTKAKKADNDNDNDNELKEKEIPNGISKKKNQKHKHGKFKNVLLTDDQYVQLQEKFPLDYDERIEELSFGIEQYGYKYKNHLLAIIQWAKNGRGKNKTKSRDDPKYKPGDYSLDAWQRRQAEHPEDDAIYEVF